MADAGHTYRVPIMTGTGKLPSLTWRQIDVRLRLMPSPDSWRLL
jgi:hypothetical protein